jgi:hypothetical protein
MAESFCGANDAKGAASYRATWQAIHDEIVSILKANLTAYGINEVPEYILDPSTKDPARFSRMPNAYRGLVKQAVLYTGNLISNAELAALCDKHKIVVRMNYAKNANLNSFMTFQEFEKHIKRNLRLGELRFRLHKAELWAASANMYEKVFKLSLWCIDETGVPQDVLLEYMHKYVFPKLVDAGYPQDKLEKGVYHAYNHKGF